MMNSLQSRATVAASVGTMAKAMGSAATIMSKQNASLAASDVAGTMHKFAVASERMAMSEDMLDDMLASCFDEDESAADDIVSEAFSEMGLGLSASLPAAPRGALEAPAGPVHAAAAGTRVALPAGASSEDAAVAAVLREVLGAK
jgi:hypothetical protein